MQISRRDLALLLPALAAAQKPAEDLPVRNTGPNAFRAILDGQTHSGFGIELHETELAAGQAPHPRRQHPNEELLLIREGTLDVTIAGRVSRLGAGGRWPTWRPMKSTAGATWGRLVVGAS